MTFEEQAEAIVRSLHGQVPSWAGGALVRKLDDPEASKIWIEDATFDAIGHTGLTLCFVENGFVKYDSWRKPTLKEVRSWGIPVYPRMMAHTFSGGINREDTALFKSEVWELMTARIGPDHRIIAAKIDGRGPVRLPNYERHNLGVTIGHRWYAENPESLWATMALEARYEWSVALKLDGAPALRFACTPASARNAFRLRDLPPGKCRRDALIHWVSEHYRNPDIHVSEHLRGKHVFEWRGIECEIVPSAYDREKEIARKVKGSNARASRGSRSASRSRAPCL